MSGTMEAFETLPLRFAGDGVFSREIRLQRRRTPEQELKEICEAIFRLAVVVARWDADVTQTRITGQPAHSKSFQLLLSYQNRVNIILSHLQSGQWVDPSSPQAIQCFRTGQKLLSRVQKLMRDTQSRGLPMRAGRAADQTAKLLGHTLQDPRYPGPDLTSPPVDHAGTAALAATMALAHPARAAKNKMVAPKLVK
jgi:hypothetical protein